MEEDKMYVAYKLRWERAKRGLTLTELAKLTNISTATICHIECGKVKPHIKTLVKLASALNIDVKELL